MTKKQMIQTIQLQEAALFLNVKQVERMFGTHSAMHQRITSKWVSVSNLMETLGIPADLTLPDSQESAQLIMQLDREKD
jgi:hypothetical protein